MAAKKTRQAKRAAERKATPTGAPMVRLDISVDEAKIIIGGLGELPIKVALDTLNKVGAAINAALTVKPKGN